MFSNMALASSLEICDTVDTALQDARTTRQWHTTEDERDNMGEMDDDEEERPPSLEVINKHRR